MKKKQQPYCSQIVERVVTPPRIHTSVPFMDYPYAAYLLCGVCCMITFGIYIHSVAHNQFVNLDDLIYVSTNDGIKSSNFKLLLTQQTLGNWAPVHMMTLWIQYHLFGLEPSGYHATSLVLHMTNVALVFLFTRILTGTTSIAFFTALLFGIHPMHAESVLWVSAQKDLLAALFWLLSMIVYARTHNHRTMYHWMIIVILVIAALLSKATAVMIPVTFLVIDCYYSKNWTIKFIAQQSLSKSLLFGGSFAIGIVAYFAQQKSKSLEVVHHAFIDQGLFVLYSLGMYVIKLWIPGDLTVLHLYPLKNSAGFFPWEFYLVPLLVIVGIVIGIPIVRTRSNQLFIFGLGFFLVTLIPVLQIVPVGFAVFAERYTYIAYIGLMMMMGWGIVTIWNGLQESRTIIRFWYGMVIVSACVIFAGMTYDYSLVWEQSIRLWTHVIHELPPYKTQWQDFAYSNRAAAFVQEETDPNAAVADYSAAIKLNPSLFIHYQNRAIVYAMIGKSDLAIKDYTTVINAKPNYSRAYNGRAMMYFSQGNAISAIRDYTTAIEYNPRQSEYFANRSRAYLSLGDTLHGFQDQLQAKRLGFRF